MKELTPKEAIKILRPDTSRDALWKIEYYAGFNGEKARLKAVEDACVVACEALEKQIPKKPKEKGTEEKIHYLCPVCNWIPITIYADGYRLGNQPKYCERCGQKLDWSE